MIASAVQAKGFTIEVNTSERKKNSITNSITFCYKYSGTRILCVYAVTIISCHYLMIVATRQASAPQRMSL